MHERKCLIENIKDIGLYCDDRGNIYGKEYEKYLKFREGIWQYPEELVDLLLFLDGKDVQSFLNIGTFNGLTFKLMADYLNRKRNVRCVSLDLYNHSPQTDPKYEYVFGQKIMEFDRSGFDFVFIDGDHSYDFVVKDWLSVRDTAKIVAFHDIADDFIAEDPICKGGVKRLWNELKSSFDTVEFLKESDEGIKKIMGIGVVIIRHETKA